MSDPSVVPSPLRSPAAEPQPLSRRERSEPLTAPLPSRSPGIARALGPMIAALTEVAVLVAVGAFQTPTVTVGDVVAGAVFAPARGEMYTGGAGATLITDFAPGAIVRGGQTIRTRDYPAAGLTAITSSSHLDLFSSFCRS